jgi:hypothetical protein
MLHVTNGTSVSLRESGLAGEVLAWIDVLHEGPVPAGLGPEKLRHVRGLFLGAEYDLAHRDAALDEFARHEEVALWFEHDLFDQLQLIQILDRLRPRAGGATRLSLICIDQYLGRLTGPQLAAYWPVRHTVTPEEFVLASAAWLAFRSPDPMDIEGMLRRGTSRLPFLDGALPFLDGALRRHLQQFPSVENGLARTERQILELVSQGKRRFPALFKADQELEERIFMGDLHFERYLRGLSGCHRPLLEERHTQYHLTEAGRAVLDGRADHVHLNGINRWLGGVHLNGDEVLWRWDERARRLERH